MCLQKKVEYLYAGCFENSMINGVKTCTYGMAVLYLTGLSYSVMIMDSLC